jgi:hypothetical protein
LKTLFQNHLSLKSSYTRNHNDFEKKLPFSVFGFLFSLDFDEADSVEMARCSNKAFGKVLQKKTKTLLKRLNCIIIEMCLTPLSSFDKTV